MSAAVASLAALLAPARRAVVFTGAGISTDSGIPDFRSTGGVWSRMKPITHQEFIGSEEARRASWGRTFSGAARWTGSKPNAGHRAVAQLMEQGVVSMVITQNVDNLHQDAGAPSDRVIELHGNAGYAACLDCGLRHELEDLRKPFLEQSITPKCRSCGGIVKTAVVSFGQPLPRGVIERAHKATLAADLFLVLGSSLTVLPAARLPAIAAEAGIPMVIVNRDPTPKDALSNMVLREEIGPLMSAVVSELFPHLSMPPPAPQG